MEKFRKPRSFRLLFFFFNKFFLRENPYESNWYFDKFWKFNFGINSVILVRVSLSVIDV